MVDPAICRHLIDDMPCCEVKEYVYQNRESNRSEENCFAKPTWQENKFSGIEITLILADVWFHIKINMLCAFCYTDIWMFSLSLWCWNDTHMLQLS